MNIRHLPKFFFPLLVFLLAALFVLLWDSPPESLFTTDQPTEKQLEAFPDAILEDATSRRFDESGRLHSLLIAQQIDHYDAASSPRPGETLIVFQTPDLTLYSQDQPPWHLTADTGESTKNNEQINLSGQVHLWKNLADGGVSELHSPRMTVLPTPQIAKTDAAVDIQSPGNRTTAVGMEAYLQQDVLRLLNTVRGIHEVQTTP